MDLKKITSKLGKGNKETTKYLLFAVIGLFLYWKFQKPTTQGEDVKFDPSIPDEDNITDNLPKETYLDITVKRGSKGEAAKRVQMRLNKIKGLCWTAYNQQKTFPNMHPDTIERVNKIAMMPSLQIDGIIGAKSEERIKYIMGSKSTTLKLVRIKYDNFKALLQ
jgi:hypothetical protein